MATTFTITRAELAGGNVASLGADTDPEVTEDDVPATTFNAYDIRSARPPSGPPAGAVIATADVETDGTVEFTGLAEGTTYLVHAEAGGRDIYMQITTDA